MGQPEVRDALQSAVDYQGIAESVYRGVATPLKALVPPAAYGYAEDTYQEAYDALPEPNQDLDKVGTSSEQTPAAAEPMTLAYFAASDEESRAATAIADSRQPGRDEHRAEAAHPAGVRCGLLLGRRHGKASTSSWSTGYLDFPEPLQYYQYFTSGTFYNFAGYNNAEYDDLVGQALTTVDDEERADLVIQAQQVLSDDDGVIPVATVDVSAVLRRQAHRCRPAAELPVHPLADRARRQVTDAASDEGDCDVAIDRPMAGPPAARRRPDHRRGIGGDLRIAATWSPATRPPSWRPGAGSARSSSTRSASSTA